MRNFKNFNLHHNQRNENNCPIILDICKALNQNQISSDKGCVEASHIKRLFIHFKLQDALRKLDIKVKIPSTLSLSLSLSFSLKLSIYVCLLVFLFLLSTSVSVPYSFLLLRILENNTQKTTPPK